MLKNLSVLFVLLITSETVSAMEMCPAKMDDQKCQFPPAQKLYILFVEKQLSKFAKQTDILRDLGGKNLTIPEIRTAIDQALDDYQQISFKPKILSSEVIAAVVLQDNIPALNKLLIMLN